MAKAKAPSEEFMRDLAEGVGRVIIAFSLLEHDFTMTLAGILKLTMLQERALIRTMSISTKIDLLWALHKEYGKKGESGRWLRFLLKDIRHCADRRNELAHSFYGTRQWKFALLTVFGGAKLSGQPIAWTPQTLGGAHQLSFDYDSKIDPSTGLWKRPPTDAAL
jgi:hypothetical protein